MTEEVKKIDDGGLAFPLDEEGPYSHVGMFLRDYFAAKAMPELLYHEGDRLPFIDVADMAYQMADAMIAARKAGAA